jgi:HTH-type transcriptional regulator / antitoxin HipB
MKDIPLRSVKHLGAVIRLKRKAKNLSQSKLAERLGVERKWVLRLEAGNPKAELGLVIAALQALDLGAALIDRNAPRPPTFSRLDEVFERLKRPDLRK